MKLTNEGARIVAESEQAWALFGAEDALAAADQRFGSSDPAVTLPAAAAALAVAGWRRTDLEDDHVAGSIDDAGMLVANTATTALVVQWLNEPEWDAELLAARIAAPGRELGHGRTVESVVTDLRQAEYEAWKAGLVAEQAALRFGREAALAGMAASGATYANHWWGMPWWGQMVDLAVEASGESLDPSDQAVLTLRPYEAPEHLASWAVHEAAIGSHAVAAEQVWRDQRNLGERPSVIEIHLAWALPMPWVAGASGALAERLDDDLRPIPGLG